MITARVSLLQEFSDGREAGVSGAGDVCSIYSAQLHEGNIVVAVTSLNLLAQGTVGENNNIIITSLI